MAYVTQRNELQTKSARRIVQQAVFLLGMLSIGLLYALFGTTPNRLIRASARERARRALHHDSRIFEISIPHLKQQALENKHRTLFLIPNKENSCRWQYNYVCKFWFYIRCFTFSAFPNVRMLSEGSQGVEDLKQHAKEGDIAIVIWRSRKHLELPNNLAQVLEWQQGAMQTNHTPRLRVGVLHVANEVNRTSWQWYLKPDFIIRNYWIPDMPAHATYIPLGPQLPNQCQPWATDHDKWLTAGTQPPCSCNAVSVPKASSRKYLWHFSGSLRKRRRRLVKILRSSDTLQSKGYIQVAKKFGGEGTFGSNKSDNPKTEYLKSILDSQFVFAPCGNAMETHRIYEAIALGAIPVIENCEPQVSYFFPFRELLVEGDVANMIEFVKRYQDKQDEIDALQQRVQEWWRQYSIEVAQNVSKTVTQHVPPPQRTAP